VTRKLVEKSILGDGLFKVGNGVGVFEKRLG
jgi:hypothetical protein